MRNYINKSTPSNVLMESVLLENHNFGQHYLAPAFAALYEEVKTRQAQKDVTDRILSDILAKHGGNITTAIAAIQSHKTGTGSASPSGSGNKADSELAADPSARLVPPEVKKSAMNQVKHALEQWWKLSNRKQPLVPDVEKFVDNKSKEVINKINSEIPDQSKFGPHKTRLQKFVSRLVKLTKKNYPSIAVATLGVLGGLLTAGGPWIGAAITALLKMVLLKVKGEPWGSALKKVLTTTFVSLLAGFGIGAAISGIDALFNSAEAAAVTAASGADALSQTDAVRELPGTGSTPSASNAQPIPSTPYIDQLRNVVDPSGEGTGIPTMTQSRFADAWRAARDAMGAGNVFVWNGEPYTTNTRQEGLLSGLSDAAKRFLRGGR